MAEKQTLNIDIVVSEGKATQSLDKVTKSTEDLNKESKQSLDNFGAFGLTLGGVKSAFGKVIPTAKAMFGSIKAGLLSTGIGAFVVILGSMMQYFKDNEEGASKLKVITSSLGVVFGNITDIISEFGEKLFNAFSNPKQAVMDLADAIQENIDNRIKGMIDSFGALGKIISGVFDGDLKTVKEGMAEFGESQIQVFTGVDNLVGKVKDNVKDFVDQTKEEVKIATQLEKDRLALQKFERKASVDKAKTESEIMKLRLQARDIENHTTMERLDFMRQANQLADEQLEKDMHVAQEKLRFQQVENSFSKSSKENLDAEAQLEAQLFQIQRSNFSERKRMKSEEQALVKEQQANEKQIAAEKEKAEQDAIKLEEENQKKREEINKKRLDDKIALAQAEQQLEMATFDAIKTGLEVVKGALKDGSKAQRNFALFQIGVDTAKAISTLVSGTEIAAAQFAAATGPAAPFTYAATKISLYATGLASIMGNINQAKELLSSEPAFASGGMVGGYGSGTSDSVSARLSKGESVINAKSTAMFQPLLSAMNVAGGGVGFARGGVAGGSSISTNASAFMSPVKTYVVTDEMTNSQNQLASIRRKATF